MSNNIQNIKKSLGNTVSAVTTTVAVTTEVAADATGYISNSIGATPAVLKAILQSPFSAAQGYLMEAEGLSEEQAKAAAFHYLEQDIAVTIEQGGVGAGKLIAQLLEDDEEEVNKANTESRNQEVINAA